jgi:hypothetical protein
VETVPGYLVPFVVGIRCGAMLAVAIVGLLILGRRSGHPGAARVTAAVLAAWFGLILGLARSGAFSASEAGPNPLLPITLVGSIALAIPLALRASFPTRIPQTALVGIQVFRLGGFVFLPLWGQGLLPAEFAWPAGVGDTLVGLFALPVAWLHRRGHAHARSAIVAWNLFGIADHALAAVLGATTAPGPFQQLAFDAPNRLMGQYPLVLIPTFIIPLSFALHALSLRRLRLERSDAIERGPA